MRHQGNRIYSDESRSLTCRAYISPCPSFRESDQERGDLLSNFRAAGLSNLLHLRLGMGDEQFQSKKSKAELRAERRAIQEAQRAAKMARKLAEKGTVVKPISSNATLSATIPSEKLQTNNQKHKLIEASEDFHMNKEEESCSKEKSGLFSLLNAFLLAERNFEPPSFRMQEESRVSLFKHLDQPDKRIDVIGSLGLGTCSPIHPVFLALGVDFDESRIRGSNERCLAFLSACEVLVRSFKSDSFAGKFLFSAANNDPLFCRAFGPVLQNHVNFIDLCRPLALTIRNAYQYLKQTLNKLDSVEDWKECRESMLTAIDDFKRDSIYLAGAEIANRTSNLIRSGECVCTFGYSSLVARVLERAWHGSNPVLNDPSKDNKQTESGTLFSTNVTDARRFSVLVVDSRPRFEGRRMLARLHEAQIPCEYTHIGALPTVAHKVSLVIVGAHALLSNGYVLARIGTAQVVNTITSIAHAPTLVCAETYKFWERAHSDAFEYNELGDPDDIWRGPRGTSSDHSKGIPGYEPTGLPDRLGNSITNLEDWRSNSKLRLLHLSYDILPPALVTAVVTEKGTLPTTSVPVVLRVKQASTIPV